MTKNTETKGADRTAFVAFAAHPYMRYSGAVPTVDVIIPAYNAAKYLSPALESVLAQEYTDWCVTLVNDGSTDATAEIANQYQRMLGNKMRVLEQANAGLPAARNAAIRASGAEFIAILDADDIWLPSRLTLSLQAFAGRPQIGLSYGLISRIDQHGRTFSTFRGNLREAEGKIASAVYTRRVEFPCPTVTFRRSCLEKVGYFDETMRATEDRDLWLRIAQQFEIAFVPEVIAQYRTSEGSMSTDMDRMLQSQRRFIEKHYGSPGCGRIQRRMAIARVFKQRAEVFAERNRRWRAVGSALRAFWMWPLGRDNVRTAASLLLKSIRPRRFNSGEIHPAT